MNILKSIAVWACFIPLAILNGGLREHVLTGIMGDLRSLAAIGVSLSGLILLATWLLLPRLVELTPNCAWPLGVHGLCLRCCLNLLSGWRRASPSRNWSRLIIRLQATCGFWFWPQQRCRPPSYALQKEKTAIVAACDYGYEILQRQTDFATLSHP